MQKKQGNSQAEKPNEDNGPQEEYSAKQGNSPTKKPNKDNGPLEEYNESRATHRLRNQIKIMSQRVHSKKPKYSQMIKAQRMGHQKSA